MTVSERIRETRKALGLTQRELGNKMGLSDVAISQYESGQRNPKIDTIHRFAQAFGVSILYLLPGFKHPDAEVAFPNLDAAQTDFCAAKREHSATDAVIQLLAYTYGGTEEKVVSGKYASTTYRVFGADGNSFCVDEEDIDSLLESLKGILPRLMLNLPSYKPEEQAVKEYAAQLSSPKLKEFLEQRGLQNGLI